MKTRSGSSWGVALVLVVAGLQACGGGDGRDRGAGSSSGGWGNGVGVGVGASSGGGVTSATSAAASTSSGGGTPATTSSSSSSVSTPVASSTSSSASTAVAVTSSTSSSSSSVAGTTSTSSSSSSTSGGGGPLCSNTCQFANDDICDDGGPDAQFSVCELGTDCADCGTRNGGGATTSTSSSSSSSSSTGGQPTGAPCTLDSQCAGGTCITELQIGWPGGYCSSDCTNAACADDEHCSRDGRCLKECSDNTQCRGPDYECYDFDSYFVTFENRECAPVGRGTGRVGDACTDYNDCDGDTHGFCLTEAFGWPDGYCARECYNILACPSGSHCAFVDNNSTAGSCMDDCTTTCRSGYSCQDADGDFVNECYPS